MSLWRKPSIYYLQLQAIIYTFYANDRVYKRDNDNSMFDYLISKLCVIFASNSFLAEDRDRIKRYYAFVLWTQQRQSLPSSTQQQLSSAPCSISYMNQHNLTVGKITCKILGEDDRSQNLYLTSEATTEFFYGESTIPTSNPTNNKTISME